MIREVVERGVDEREAGWQRIVEQEATERRSERTVLVPLS